MIESVPFKQIRKEICEPLIEAGFEVFIVGGAIRNAILGRPIDDIDLTTNAQPDQIESLFENTVATGKKFGTITVILKKEAIKTVEVTSYRSEHPYSDSRHPDNVTFETDINKDLERRDFTINALAYNPVTNEFVDNHGSLNDLKRGVIKCIGEPKKRFEEDTLRIFRAFRFLSQLDFEFDKETKQAIKIVAPSFQLPSMERIRHELEKIMMSPSPSKTFLLLREYGVLKRLSNELTKISKEQIMTCDSSEKDIRWAVLFKNIDYKTVCKTLRFGRKQSRYIQALIQSNCDKRKAFATVKELNIDSKDLIEIGFKGVSLGRIQRILLAHILDYPEENTAEHLIQIAKKEVSYEN